METSDGRPATQWLRSQSRDKAAFACQQAEADQWLAVLVCESVRQGRVDGAQGKTLNGLPTGVTDVASGPGATLVPHILGWDE